MNEGTIPEEGGMYGEDRRKLNASAIQVLDGIRNVPLEGRSAVISTEQSLSDLMKRKVLALLVQHAEFLENLEAQFTEALKVWTEKFPLGVEIPLSVSQLSAWLRTLSPTTLNGLLKLNANRLVIVPPKKASELLALINTAREKGEQDPDNDWPEFWESIAAQGWSFAITDLRRNIPLDLSIYYKDEDSRERREGRTLEEVVEAYDKQFTALGVSIMPPHGYLPSAASVDSWGLDTDSHTDFKRPQNADKFPSASLYTKLYPSYFRLGSRRPGAPGNSVRCRPWVEGS